MDDSDQDVMVSPPEDLGDVDLKELEKLIKDWVQPTLKSLVRTFRRKAWESLGKVWVAEIQDIQSQATKSVVIKIGIIGPTGAGKSSLVNAILGFEQIVPTNCMRACTVVVTEISYNPQLTWDANIEYLTANEWEEELGLLFSVLHDAAGQLYAESTDENTESGSALVKLKAVYPKLTKEKIRQAKIKDLLKLEGMEVLGTTAKIHERKRSEFCARLSQFLDTGNSTKGIPGGSKQAHHWPLIRRVHLFVRSSALANGIQIVDLPGTNDNNAARAKIAEDYIRTCTGLIVVSTINRAADDRTAKQLLGNAFKRQIKMDNKINSIAFVATKTDEISPDEVPKNLPIGTEIEAVELRILELESDIDERLPYEIALLRIAQRECSDEMASLRSKEGQWTSLKEEIARGENLVSQSKELQMAKRTRENIKEESLYVDLQNRLWTNKSINAKLTAQADIHTKIIELLAAERGLQTKQAKIANDIIALERQITAKRRRNQLKRKKSFPSAVYSATSMLPAY